MSVAKRGGGAVGASLAFLVAGCGSGGSTGSAQPDSKPSTTLTQAAGPLDSWAQLRRPLTPPSHRPGRPCPRTSGGRAAPDAGITIGTGPVYPVLGMPAAPPSTSGVVDVTDDAIRDGRQYHKTLLALPPKQRGRVLIRGSKIGGPRILFYLGPPLDDTTVSRVATQQELRMPRVTKAPREWRYQPINVVLAGSGCYWLQFDTTRETSTVAFEVAGP